MEQRSRPPRPLTVLAVDDDEGVRAMLRLALPRFGFAVRLAAGGEEAVEVYLRHGAAVDLVLTDVRMAPGMDGPQTVAALRELNPGLRFCFMSGDSGGYTMPALLALGAAHVFQKPFADLEEFARALRQAAMAGGG